MSPPETPQTSDVGGARFRVRVFVDYWNLQLTLNEREAALRNVTDYRFKVDWKGLGHWLAGKACETAGIGPNAHSYEGIIIYASYDPRTAAGRSDSKWMRTWLDVQPGVNVRCLERQPKHPPKCTKCYGVIEYCPNPDCKEKMVGTVEKGVDTFIATDMIRLAWEKAYDIAVLATSDRDLIPAVEFLAQKGLRVIQAGFPPIGIDLAKTCWASFDIFPHKNEIERPY